MKYIFLISYCLLFCIAKAQTGFTFEIKGKIKGMGNDTLWVMPLDNKEGKKSPIGIPARDDRFEYKGSFEQAVVAWAEVGRKRREEKNFTFFLEKGTILIDGDLESLSHTAVTGTKGNDEYAYVTRQMNHYYDQLKPLQSILRTNKDTASLAFKKAYQGIGLIHDSVRNFEYNYAKEHPNSLPSVLMLHLIQDQFSVNEIEDLYNNLSPELKKNPILAKLPQRIAAKKTTMIGKPALDFTMKDVNGKAVSLADFKGKYVLLDFWASWCGPCRAENPALVAAYEKFRQKGFEIVSVSVDHDGDAWRKAILKDGLTWVHLSDLSGNKNPVANLYGVKPIPDNFLISPDKKIVARGLRGKEVEEVLGKYLQ